MFIKVTQCRDLDPGPAASKIHAQSHSSEVPREGSDATHPYNLAEIPFSY